MCCWLNYIMMESETNTCLRNRLQTYQWRRRDLAACGIALKYTSRQHVHVLWEEEMVRQRGFRNETIISSVWTSALWLTVPGASVNPETSWISPSPHYDVTTQHMCFISHKWIHTCAQIKSIHTYFCRTTKVGTTSLSSTKTYLCICLSETLVHTVAFTLIRIKCSMHCSLWL